MKVKSFTDTNSIALIIKEVNKWLEENPRISIMHIKQCMSTYTGWITIWYEE